MSVWFQGRRGDARARGTRSGSIGRKGNVLMATTAMRGRSNAKVSAIRYEHPGAFWFGVAAVAVGVVMHLPFYFSAKHDCALVPTTVPVANRVHQCYILAGKTPDAAMWLGMLVIL